MRGATNLSARWPRAKEGARRRRRRDATARRGFAVRVARQARVRPRAARDRGQGAARRRRADQGRLRAVEDGELWLHNVHIPPYAPAARENHEPERPRKLLAKRREIERLIGQQQEKGLTLVPTRIYFKGPRAKVEIALARGKDRFDKRQSSRSGPEARHGSRAARRAPLSRTTTRRVRQDSAHE